MSNCSHLATRIRLERLDDMTKPLGPRRQPRQPRAVATRDAILEAAAHIIGTGGLAAFNTNAVALRAGVSIGSLYQYFPNKDALMLALIASRQAQQVERIVWAFNGLSADVGLAEVVRILVRAAMQHHRDDALLASAIDHEEARLPAGDVIAAALDDAGALVATILTRFPGQVAPISSAIAGQTLPALVRAVVDQWANLSPPQLDRAESEAVRAVLGYLCCSADQEGV
jgi:AcrR family transcriptional regulator